MKKAIFLSVALTAALFLSSCANQGTLADRTSGVERRGLVDAGSVAPVSGGPAGPRSSRQRFQP